MTDYLNEILVELRRRFGKLYGLRLVRLVLFGSRARGDAEPDSDIDILVVLEGQVDAVAEIHRTSEIVAGLSLDYDAVIACIFMSREQADYGGSALLLNIRREGVLV